MEAAIAQLVRTRQNGFDYLFDANLVWRFYFFLAGVWIAKSNRRSPVFLAWASHLRLLNLVQQMVANPFSIRPGRVVVEKSYFLQSATTGKVKGVVVSCVLI